MIDGGRGWHCQQIPFWIEFACFITYCVSWMGSFCDLWYVSKENYCIKFFETGGSRRMSDASASDTKKRSSETGCQVLCGHKAGAGREGSKVKWMKGRAWGRKDFTTKVWVNLFSRAFCNIALSKSSDTMRLLTSSWKQTGNAFGEKPHYCIFLHYSAPVGR